ncbi:transmembrane and coiled-coil domain-containing protein 4 [Diaporthe amygdali]|uniref:transmembrane and coiled-coil domain-containing protein 4 n=1 Tax=Phomopsis amygdali TaxID=1214568 RepID=UPI0022FEE73D|nr:transmembrane and coiled-coil domain-containing protein 4 [Diaporthe amygdali]KAJ0125015.1 transmembrane and coiled-coil domain-containing protein 4 [Diaporthe amygdali]
MEASLPSSSKATKKGGCQSSDPPLNDAGYEPDGDDSPNEDTEVEVIVNDSDLNMPSNRQRPPPRREADMSSIINTAQRAELSTLIEAIMEKISTQVQKPFTFLSHPAAQKNRVQVWNYAPVMEAAVASVDPAAGPPTNGVVVYGYCKPSMSVQELDDAGVCPDPGETEATPDPEKVQGQDAGDADHGADDDDGKAPFVIIPEIGANSVEATVPSMSELQKDVSSYFGKWKAAFQKRFNDFVVPKFANSSAGPPGQGQGPPRGGAVGAGASGRTQQPQQAIRGIAYQADLNLIRRFPPAQTPLTTLPVDKRRLLLHSIMLMLLSTEHYIAYSHIFMMYLASSLHIPMYALIEDENRVAQSLGKIYKTLCDESEKCEAEEQKKVEELKKANECKKSDAVEHTDTTDAEEIKAVQETKQVQGTKPVKDTRPLRKYRPVTNPVQAGTTLLAAGLGMMPAGQGLPAVSLPPVTVANLLGSLSDNESALATFFGVNPNRPSTKSIDSFALTLQDISFIPLHGPEESGFQNQKDVAPEDRRMRLVLCVNGLLTNKDDVGGHWKKLGSQNETYIVRWETETLEKIGSAFETLLKSKAWAECQKELNRTPILTKMLLSDWPNALLRSSKVVDNAWIMGMTRSTKLSSCLSDLITGHLHGERGLTLIGYGVGARAIYLTLTYLAERKLYGLVDSVILMGAPVPGDTGTWTALKSVVTGRFVNVFAKNDYMLAFASRSGPSYFVDLVKASTLRDKDEDADAGMVLDFSRTRKIPSHRAVVASMVATTAIDASLVRWER